MLRTNYTLDLLKTTEINIVDIPKFNQETMRVISNIDFNYEWRGSNLKSVEGKIIIPKLIKYISKKYDLKKNILSFRVMTRCTLDDPNVINNINIYINLRDKDFNIIDSETIVINLEPQDFFLLSFIRKPNTHTFDTLMMNRILNSFINPIVNSLKYIDSFHYDYLHDNCTFKKISCILKRNK